MSPENNIPQTPQQTEHQAARNQYEAEIQASADQINSKLSTRILGKVGLAEAVTPEGLMQDEANAMDEEFNKEHFHTTVDYEKEVSPDGGFPNGKLIAQNLGVYKPQPETKRFKGEIPATSRKEAEDEALARYGTGIGSTNHVVTIGGERLPLREFVGPAVERHKQEPQNR